MAGTKVRTEAEKVKRRAYDQSRRAIINEQQRRYRADPKNYAALRASQRKSYQTHRADRIARTKRWYADPLYRAQKKSDNLKTLYGITLLEFSRLSELQGGVCAICHNGERSTRKAHLSVDHDHATGMVRGLLCSSCNTALGLLFEDENIVLSMLEYVRRHGCQSSLKIASNPKQRRRGSAENAQIDMFLGQ